MSELSYTIPHTVRYLCEWYNLLPQRSEKHSPRDIVFGSSTIIHQLFHPFGCRISFQLSTPTPGGTSKVEPIARDGVYLGFYLDQVVGHIIYDSVTNKVVHTTNVFFDDNVKGFEEPILISELLKLTALYEKESSADSPKDGAAKDGAAKEDAAKEDAAQEDSTEDDTKKRTIQQVEAQSIPEPVCSITPRNPTTREAVHYPAWTGAMSSEFENHEHFGTFEIVPRPANTRLLPLSWVFSTKTNLDGSVEKYKARLVAAGNRQPYRLDEVNTAPTSDQAIVKIVISIALQYGWPLEQADVHAAYLHADIEEDVYTRFPNHSFLHFPDVNPQTHCLKLRKALYGLRSSGRRWYDHFASKLRELNFHSLETCETVFTKTYPTGVVIVILYVDGCLLTGSTDELIQQAYAEVRLSGVELEKFGQLSHFLGIHYQRTGKHSMTLFRPISRMVDNLTTKATPATPSLQQYFTKVELRESPKFQFPLRSIVGDVNYTALSVRPDLTFATSYLSRYLEHSNKLTWRFAKQIQNYLRHTAQMKLHFSGTHTADSAGFHIFCDNDYASDPITRDSCGGFIVMLNGNPIYWHSRKSSLICTSSTHAELEAAFNAVEEVRWLFHGNE